MLFMVIKYRGSTEKELPHTQIKYRSTLFIYLVKHFVSQSLSMYKSPDFVKKSGFFRLASETKCFTFSGNTISPAGFNTSACY